MCQIVVGSNLSQIKGEYEGKSVLFVTLDSTDERLKARSGLLASQMGFSRIWEEYQNKLGLVLLVEASTGNVMDVINAKHSSSEMKHKLEKALKANGYSANQGEK